MSKKLEVKVIPITQKYRDNWDATFKKCRDCRFWTDEITCEWGLMTISYYYPCDKFEENK